MRASSFYQKMVATKLHARRQEKARTRADMTTWLRINHRQAGKLYKTGTRPQAEYAHESIGLAPTQIAAHTRIALIASGAPGLQPCTHAALALKMPDKDTPAVRIPLEQFAAWIATWKSADGQQRKEFTQAWRAARRKCAESPP